MEQMKGQNTICKNLVKWNNPSRVVNKIYRYFFGKKYLQHLTLGLSKTNGNLVAGSNTGEQFRYIIQNITL